MSEYWSVGIKENYMEKGKNRVKVKRALDNMYGAVYIFSALFLLILKKCDLGYWSLHKWWVLFCVVAVGLSQNF